MPTSTVEDYLKCIYLESRGAPDERASTGRIATALNVAPGTVTAMMKTLTESGLVGYEPYAGVRLTEAGLRLATHVLRRHRLVELFLVRIMGMDWSEVHEEAEVLEHAVSERLIERIDSMLGQPSVDPHGDPIPTAGGEIDEPELDDLLTCAVRRRLTVARVTDQRTEFLQLLDRHGVTPGQSVLVLSRDTLTETVRLDTRDGGGLQLGFRAASKILVR
ncbi:MAG TPA: metal-dependent transcriptional regulator [Candidatus Polarisedimenticolaceae bacterium]|nr:metal-dependent transcriptional regulator [Candidatus Polarisedimenticolaceae bacterium]